MKWRTMLLNRVWICGLLIVAAIALRIVDIVMKMMRKKMMIRKPTMQVEQMEKANVRHGYSTRRSAEMIEQEQEDERKPK